VRTELLQHEVVVESMGGDVIEVEVSALKGTNLDKLLDDPAAVGSARAQGQPRPHRGRHGHRGAARQGPRSGGDRSRPAGTLKVGDILVAGAEWGRVRAMINEDGEQVKEAGPSLPVEVLGFQGTPRPATMVAVVENEARAREIVEYRQRQLREKASVARRPVRAFSLEQMMNQLQESGHQEFPLLVKGDVQGSVEAIAGALDKLGTDEVKARIVHAGVGGITESDVTLAAASGAPIIGFNVRANKQARDAAERERHRDPLLQHHLQPGG
jgi:translation initiation factor IF-2